MRMSIFTVALLLAGGSAMASSIEPINGNRDSNGSILLVGCAHCPALKKDVRVKEYSVPSLASGALETEMREVDGKPEMIRTDALLGGSPVVYISKTQTWFPVDKATSMAAKGEAEHPESGDGIDVSAKTSAVNGSEPDASVNPSSSAQPLRTDFSDFSLRLQ